MRDYQNIQRRVCQFQATPSQEECNEIGYTSLRQCHAEARTLLAVPYPPELLHAPSAPNEAEKRQLQRYAPSPSTYLALPLLPSMLIRQQRVITDASARRFQAQKIFLRAAAAIKWVQLRQSILQGGKPQTSHLQALRQADTALRNVNAPICFFRPPPRDQQFQKPRGWHLLTVRCVCVCVAGTGDDYEREDRKRF